jgi:hypothetical protein
MDWLTALADCSSLMPVSGVSTGLRDYTFGSSAESVWPTEDWLPKGEAQVMGVTL